MNDEQLIVDKRAEVSPRQLVATKLKDRLGRSTINVSDTTHFKERFMNAKEPKPTPKPSPKPSPKPKPRDE